MRRFGGGARRRKPMDVRKTGWDAPMREKVSPYASEYAYEVRLPHANRWPLSNDPQPYEELSKALKLSTDCRIVGISPVKDDASVAARRMWSVRVYLKTEADLFHMRMLTNEVFRVYRLKAA